MSLSRFADHLETHYGMLDVGHVRNNEDRLVRIYVEAESAEEAVEKCVEVKGEIIPWAEEEINQLSIELGLDWHATDHLVPLVFHAENEVSVFRRVFHKEGLVWETE